MKQNETISFLFFLYLCAFQKRNKRTTFSQRYEIPHFRCCKNGKVSIIIIYTWSTHKYTTRNPCEYERRRELYTIFISINREDQMTEINVCIKPRSYLFKLNSYSLIVCVFEKILPFVVARVFSQSLVIIMIHLFSFFTTIVLYVGMVILYDILCAVYIPTVSRFFFYVPQGGLSYSLIEMRYEMRERRKLFINARSKVSLQGMTGDKKKYYYIEVIGADKRILN